MFVFEGAGMKIWVALAYRPGQAKTVAGVENFWLELQKHLKHDIVFFSGDSAYDIIGTLKTGREIRKQLEKEKPDIILSNGPYGWNLTDLDIPRIHIYHGTYFGMTQSVKSRTPLGDLYKLLISAELEKRSGKGASKVAVSALVKNEVVRYYGFPDEDVRVIYNGVDTKKFKQTCREEKETLRSQYNLPSDKVVCCYVGALTFRKGWDIVKRLAIELPHVLFLCTRYFVRDLTDMQGLSLPYDRMQDIYNISDIYLYPSKYEGNILGLLEAMSSSLPFVGFPSGLAYELKESPIFRDFIVDVNDYQMFKERLELLIDDEKLRGEYGRVCRNFAEQFDWISVAEKYESLIENAAR